MVVEPEQAYNSRPSKTEHWLATNDKLFNRNITKLVILSKTDTYLNFTRRIIIAVKRTEEWKTQIKWCTKLSKHIKTSILQLIRKNTSRFVSDLYYISVNRINRRAEIPGDDIKGHWDVCTSILQLIPKTPSLWNFLRIVRIEWFVLYLRWRKKTTSKDTGD